MKSYGILGLMALFITAPANAAVMNYVITGYATGSNPIVSVRTGFTTNVGTGGPTNTILTSTGAFVDFTIGDADAIVGDKFLEANINALPTVATLRVTLNAISGGGTELMLARTSNSQGLTDRGTMSILLDRIERIYHIPTEQCHFPIRLAQCREHRGVGRQRPDGFHFL